MKIDRQKPVMVTGATGYIAGWLIKKLLEEGVTVHAAVRNPDNEDKLKHLNEIAFASSGVIKYFKTDLLTDGSYDEAMKDCELVYHTASPFILTIKDAQKDLIQPAVNGTRNVLESANRTPSVKRVVVTSSCASIYGDSIDLRNTKNGIFTEEDWNVTSSETHQAYSYSKVMAEKEAWKIAKNQDRWDLITVNPSFVLGPGTNAKATSASFDILKQMGSGVMKMGAPEFNIGAVDVRDVALAHYLAGYTENAQGRYITSAEDTGFLQLAEMLQSNYGGSYPLPKRKLPKLLLWLMGKASGMSRKEISRNIGYPWKADNSKIKRELGISFRPVNKAVNEMFQQLIDTKQI